MPDQRCIRAALAPSRGRVRATWSPAARPPANSRTASGQFCILGRNTCSGNKNCIANLWRCGGHGGKGKHDVFLRVGVGARLHRKRFQHAWGQLPRARSAKSDSCIYHRRITTRALTILNQLLNMRGLCQQFQTHGCLALAISDGQDSRVKKDKR